MTEQLDDDAADHRAPGPDGRWRRRLLLVLIPALATAVVFACGLIAGRELIGGDPAPTTAAAPREPSETVTVTAVPTPKPSPPTRLIVRSLRIDAPVVDIDLGTDAVLEPPEDPELVGYWTGSAKIGALQGRTVITGHTVQDGDGALDELPDVKPGATVQVASYSGLHSYRVTDNLYATYEDVAKHAEDIFGQSEESPGGARLILITCTEFNGQFYEGNSIIVAEPVPTPATELPTGSPTPTPSPTPTDTPSPVESEEPAEEETTSPAPTTAPTRTPPTSTPASPAPTRTPPSPPPPTSTPTATPTASPTPTPSETPSEVPSPAVTAEAAPGIGRPARSRVRDAAG